jgi:hypothetical protein
MSLIRSPVKITAAGRLWLALPGPRAGLTNIPLLGVQQCRAQQIGCRPQVPNLPCQVDSGSPP